MKRFLLFLIILTVSISALAQKPDDVLARVGDRTITLADLSEAARTAVEMTPTRLFATRKSLFDQMVNERLIELEAKSLKISSDKLIARETAKVLQPTAAAVKQLYDANRATLGNAPLEQVSKQLVAYLRGLEENRILDSLTTRLRVKYKFVQGKSVNGAALAPTDVVGTINSRPITAKDYEEFARPGLFRLELSLNELVLNDLDDAIGNALIAAEAKSLGIEPETLIEREITSKINDSANFESLVIELVQKLRTKHKPLILYKPLAQTISVDDDPATGSADAAVTIVMFSDFQCSACSGTHPILKKVMADYPGKIRFVVRDYPLENIHENAFKAARAAGAANVQGKYFEYTELLYARQQALDAASLRKYAMELGLNVKQFELDFNSEKGAAEVRKDQTDGDIYGVNGTPTIFVNGIKVRDISADGLRAAIDFALAK